MTNTTLRNIAVGAGVILFIPAFVISPALGVVFAVVLFVGFFAAQRVMGKSEVRVKKDNVDDLLDRMWIPVRDELSEVVRTGGRVTSATSVWSGVPNLYKQETPATFHRGMEWYVNRRAQAAALVASVTDTEDSRQQQETEQQKLLFMSRELLVEATKVINSIPGSKEAVRRAEAARPRPSAQRPRPAATRPSAGTRQPTAASRSAQAQTVTSATTIRARPAPSRPAPAPMRIAETPTKPSAPRPAPTPLRITDAPTPPESVVPPPAPSAPTVPTPVVASPPEPVVVAPAPITSEPPAQPSEPPADLKLDVASVCEELFNPKMMSYEANRLFDDRYKDATVRWTGTTRRASAYSYDFNFGDGGGTKAEFDVYEVKQQYGSRTVKAFVQLPQEAAADLGARIGEDVLFEGRLMTCEGSARRIYVADARMVD